MRSILRSLINMAINQIRKLRKYSQRQEKRAATDLGARVEAASGATAFGGADARKVGELRIECKFTDADNYPLTLEELLKLKKQAIIGGLEEPVFQIEFRKHGLCIAVIALDPDWDVKPFIGTGKKSLTLSVSTLKSFAACQVNTNDALLRIGFWEGGVIDTDIKPIQFLVFFWDDYISKRKEYNARNQSR